VRAAYLDRVKFDRVYTSPLRRAALTANRAVPEGTTITLENDLGPGFMGYWDGLFERLDPADYPTTLSQLQAQDPGLVDYEKYHIVNGLLLILAECNWHVATENANALLVSHEPLISLARDEFFPDFNHIETLEKGGIYRMNFEKYHVLKGFQPLHIEHFPPPSA
jgi:broad specificity phosphatase PhoE